MRSGRILLREPVVLEQYSPVVSNPVWLLCASINVMPKASPVLVLVHSGT
jgi:hypothetical protein